MSTLGIALGSLILYLIAYHTYGRWLARKIFKLDPSAPMPSVELNDDKDYVPTDKSVLFGHHFTSIAGTGPIVGPAIAVIWGWVPALIWVLLGSILFGAVHDFGSLVVSMRNRGQTVGDIAGRVLTPRVRLLFLLILFMALTIVLAIFGLVIAVVFRNYPAAIFPCLVQIPLAIAIGVWLHRKGIRLFVPSLIALGLMYVSVAYGDVGFLKAFNESLAAWPLTTWVMVLLVYSYVASVLPVWSLLQPRDFINSLQLLSALGLVLLGLLAAAFIGGAPVSANGAEAVRQELSFAAPAYQASAPGAPILFPFLFITIACGAVSGFHCLVSSGTSSKQLKCETDAQFVGYGSMLTEGFLAVIVILACAAGLGLGIAGPNGATLVGHEAWLARYGDWKSLGLPQKVGAFVDGSANFLKALGLGSGFAVALMGVLVASFAATTLDTACRLQRYVIQELAGTFVKGKPITAPKPGVALTANPLTWLTNKHGATIFAILLAGWMAFTPAGPGKGAGTGGLILWPLFGATNQLLGGLAFLVITFWMWRRKLPIWFVAIPTVFMLILPCWAMLHQLFIQAVGSDKSWIELGSWHLVFIAVATIALEIWMIVEAISAWPKARGVLEPELPPLRAQTAAENEGGRSC